MFGSCSTQHPNCFSHMGRGVAWTATTEARLKADLAAGLGAPAIAKKHGWNKVSVQRAIRKVRSGASLLTKAKSYKITETASNYIKDLSEKDKSLAEIRRGTTTDFGVSLSRSTISGHLRTKLKKKSVKKVRTFRLRDINQKKRKAFCEQLLPRLKLGKARVLAKCRPGIDVRSIALTDEKFFRLEQDDWKQRVWLDSGTTKKATLFRVTRLFRLCAH